MADLERFLERIQSTSSAVSAESHLGRDNGAMLPAAPAATRAAMALSFERELERLSAHWVEAPSLSEAAREIVGIARSKNVRRAVVAAGVGADMDRVAEALKEAGIEVYGPSITKSELAQCDAGIDEAAYAIAASGSLLLVGGTSRPRSVSLLPPLSIVIVHIDRLVADLATALKQANADLVEGRPVTLVAGPSRTADIEKRIVLGAHGPAELYVVLIWPER